jgi:hypothetical protein
MTRIDPVTSTTVAALDLNTEAKFDKTKSATRLQCRQIIEETKLWALFTWYIDKQSDRRRIPSVTVELCAVEWTA